MAATSATPELMITKKDPSNDIWGHKFDANASPSKHQFIYYAME